MVALSCDRDVDVSSQRHCHLQNKAKSDKNVLNVHRGRVIFFEYDNSALKNNTLRIDYFSAEVIAGFSNDDTPKIPRSERTP